MKKNDILLLLIIAAVASVALASAVLLTRGSGEFAVVTADGEEYARLPLNKDTELLITSQNGSNLLVIKDGEVRIISASCPDKLCARMGAANELKSIVCLPNHVTVTIEK